MSDTIAAISTSLGVGAISIVRVSGNDAISIVNSIFEKKDLSKVKSHTIHYGHIVDNKKIIDEVLVSVMRAPKTFTAEDVVEINCHGGISTTNKVLTLLLLNGARMAEPGEFSKRAFLNGRIDLIEAEGIMDLINAKTDKMHEAAINQIGGHLSKLINELRTSIQNILINIDVNIDYPEYEDILVITKDMIINSLSKAKKDIDMILQESKNSRIVADGIRTLILGKPNVGKSSILNSLLDEDKAIVSKTPGTTRDVVEGNVQMDGILLNIVDTAGIRKTKNKVEQIGVTKSMNQIDTADLIILVFNNSEQITEEEIKFIKKLNKKPRIIFINKDDLKSKIDESLLKNEIIVYGNTVNKTGLVKLKEKIKEMFGFDRIQKSDLMYLTNARQVGILNEIQNVISDVETSLKSNIPIDIITIDLRKIWQLLGNIIGENHDEDLIDELFKQFCLGK